MYSAIEENKVQLIYHSKLKLTLKYAQNVISTSNWRHSVDVEISPDDNI